MAQMEIELMLSPFDATVADVRRASAQADALGIGAIWTMDHFAGNVHPQHSTVLECLTTLGVMAAATERCRIGSMVLNAVAREPVVLAQALATLQEACEGRLVVGVGAGGGGGDYQVELERSGMIDHPARVRRQRLAETVQILSRVWSPDPEPFIGDLHRFEGGPGFLTPEPTPPIIVAGYGPKVAALAGELGSGFNTSADHGSLAEMVSTARAASADPGFGVSAYALYGPQWLDAASEERQRVAEAGVDTLIIVTDAPHSSDVIAEIGAAAAQSR